MMTTDFIYYHLEAPHDMKVVNVEEDYTTVFKYFAIHRKTKSSISKWVLQTWHTTKMTAMFWSIEREYPLHNKTVSGLKPEKNVKNSCSMTVAAPMWPPGTLDEPYRCSATSNQTPPLDYYAQRLWSKGMDGRSLCPSYKRSLHITVHYWRLPAQKRLCPCTSAMIKN